jgi:hypothetical protein
MAFKMKYKNLQGIVDQLRSSVKGHAKQADIIEDHIEDMEGDSPKNMYVSDAQRKAVHASKADGGEGNPNKMLGDLNKDGVMSSYEQRRQDAIEANSPKDKSPYNKKTKKRTLTASCKAAARRKFDVYPSAYANMWASRQQGQGKC